MEKIYVSLEIAKLLKEKGFIYRCDFCYDKDELVYLPGISNEGYSIVYAAPTLYTACKWLIDEYAVYIVVKPHYSAEYEIIEFEYEIYNYINVVIEKAEPIKFEEYYEDYFQCLSDAILEALKLI